MGRELTVSMPVPIELMEAGHMLQHPEVSHLQRSGQVEGIVLPAGQVLYRDMLCAGLPRSRKLACCATMADSHILRQHCNFVAQSPSLCQQ